MTWTPAACPPDPETVRAALGETGVVVIRDAGLSDAEFVAFLQALGPLTFTDGEAPHPEEPLLNVVSNVGRTTPPRSVFHTDTSYVDRPPAYTALKAERVPEAGGETVFANLYDAHDRLSGPLRERLRGAEVLHEVTGVTPSDGAQTRAWHPLFRRHPISGRVALWLSTPERCTDLRLPGGTRKPELVAELYAHATDPAHEMRHRWRPGDVVIWDNRCTLHRGDHSAVSGDRVLHRGMVLGEAPLAA
jgi:taurine dioxygenase